MAKSFLKKNEKLQPKVLRALKFKSRAKRSCHLCGKEYSYDSKSSYEIYCHTCQEENEYLKMTDQV